MGRRREPGVGGRARHGGALIATLGWRSIFLINLPVGALGLWLTARHAPRARAKARCPLDITGQL